MQARFPGTCRDCGNRFPAGTDIDWQKGKGASCCNGSPQVAPQASKSPTVVNGAQRMEWVDGKTTQEVVGFQGDSLVYEQKEYSGYSWMCLGCRLVWERQHQAINCESRGHVASFEQSYGGTVWDGRGFTPHGLVAGKYLPGTGTVYVRTAIRREKSTDTPPVAPAPVPQVEEPAPRRESGITYMPDAIAETMEGVSKDLYAALWQIAAKLPYERLHPGEVGTQELTERQLAGRMKKNGASAETIANLKEVLRKDKEELDSWMNENPVSPEELASDPTNSPQDMTSEQLWESMGPGTITTSWN